MKGTHNPKQLVVEGPPDLFAIARLMQAYVDWQEGNAAAITAPVYIHTGNGATEILKQDFLPVFLKNSVLRIGGVVLDADTNPPGRYQSIRDLCLPQFPDLPTVLPTGGLIVENQQGKRFGVWIMPDNQSAGSIETFLKWLVPSNHAGTWSYAEQVVATARSMGCGCRDAHVAKANLYTWLAWQDPPGQSPGTALAQKILDPHSPHAAAFVTWFKDLYQLPPKSQLF